MAEYPAGKITVKGIDFQLAVDDDGQWLTRPEGGTGRPVRADSRDALRDQLTELVSAMSGLSRIAVRFIGFHGDGNAKTAQAGEATGVHSGNGTILVRWADGTRGQVSRLTGRKHLAGTADPAEWQRLYDASTAAGKALYAYEQAHRIDLYREVSNALRAAARTPRRPKDPV